MDRVVIDKVGNHPTCGVPVGVHVVAAARVGGGLPAVAGARRQHWPACERGHRSHATEINGFICG